MNKYVATIQNYETGDCDKFYCMANNWEDAQRKMQPHEDSTLSLIDLQEAQNENYY